MLNTCLSLSSSDHSGRCYRRLGHQGGAGGDQRYQAAPSAPESNGCWGWGQPRGQSQGLHQYSLNIFLNISIDSVQGIRHPSVLFILLLSSQGDRSGGRDERVAGPEGGLPGDCRVSVGPAAALPSDPQHHRRREELHHHLPAAAGDDAGLHETLRRSLKAHRSHAHTHTTCITYMHTHTLRPLCLLSMSLWTSRAKMRKLCLWLMMHRAALKKLVATNTNLFFIYHFAIVDVADSQATRTHVLRLRERK